MAALKKSMQIVLNEIFRAGMELFRALRHLKIGELVGMVRRQLDMPQRILAKRARIAQSTLSRLESGKLNPRLDMLERIADALSCDLVITLQPRGSLEEIRQEQARTIALRRIDYVAGTMALEGQKPKQELLDALVQDEIESLLRAGGATLWESDR